jgi:hypothetical protein
MNSTPAASKALRTAKSLAAVIEVSRSLLKLAQVPTQQSWAHKTLAEKDKLIGADAQRVEAAFHSHLAQFEINADLIRTGSGNSAAFVGARRE